jgi:hypothetical protein
MSEGYHPEVDDSPLCAEDDSAKYRSIIGYWIWIIVLGRFDIAYATSAMSRFNMLPREGHLKAVKRVKRILSREKLQFHPLRLVRVRPIKFVHLLPLGNKRNGRVLEHRRRQSSRILGKRTHGHFLD